MQELLSLVPRWNHEHPTDDIDFQILRFAGMVYNVQYELSIETCCWITAASLRRHLLPRAVWKDTEDLEEALEHRMFQVAFYTDSELTDLEHIVTVIDDAVIQSLWRRYTARSHEINREYIRIAPTPVEAMRYLSGYDPKTAVHIAYKVPVFV